MKITAFYICVKNIKRAISFYEKVLEQKVTDKHKGLFVCNGIHLYLCDYYENRVPVIFGDNCLISFEVNDINVFMNKLKMLGAPITFPLTKIGNNYVLEFKDSEGNDIEVYSKYKGDSQNYNFY